MSNVNIENVKNYLFYKMPKCILKDEPYKSNLSPLSKLAYMLLLDRLSLSASNNMIDNNKDIFIFYSRQEMQDNLMTTRKTVISIFKQLEELKLITQIEQGKGLAFKIYLTDIFSNQYTKNKVVENLHITSGKITPPLVEKVYLNNNEYNNNINHNSSNEVLQNIKEKCNLHLFDKVILKSGVSIGSLFNSTIDTLFYISSLKLEKETLSKQEIQSLLSTLNESHLTKVQDIFISNYENVRNYKSYLMTCVCNVILGKEIQTNMISKNKITNSFHGREYTKEFLESFYDNIDYEKNDEELEM